MVERIAKSAAQLGRGIRALRKKKLWNQDKLAEKSGINRATLSLLEGGKSNPSFIVVEDIASALDTSVSGLMVEGRASLRLSDERLTHIFAENVKFRRLALGLSRTELGQRIDLLPQYISTTENARRLPSLKNIFKLATALECYAYLLLLETDSREVENGAVRNVGNNRTADGVVSEMKNIRITRGWSRVDVCRVTGLDPAHLLTIEAGAHYPTLQTLLAFCDGVQINISELLQKNIC